MASVRLGQKRRAVMAGRKIVSPTELNTWLTAQIQKVDGCKDCKLTWKHRLLEPEKHGGCNWSELNLRYGDGTDHDTAVKAALTIEREAFEQYNLEEEPPPPPLVAPKFKVVMLPRLLHGPIFHLDANLMLMSQEVV
jgi:hypothetical protein